MTTANRSTVEPITTSGWYANEDGTVSEYAWRAGALSCGRTVASWADVPSRDDDLRAAAAAMSAEVSS